ncbi:MAG: peptidoglycan binding domain-containing protein [Chloroflexi bacterium]|nr:peptidoglycan binding domain-containing protein [Chloroflexota bacterium]
MDHELRTGQAPNDAPEDPAAPATESRVLDAAPATPVGATSAEATFADAVPADGAPAPEVEVVQPGAVEPAGGVVKPGRPRPRRVAARFGVAFTFGILGVLAISAGALGAYESTNAGRILPGVHIGAVDLSGLGPAEAGARLREAYGVLANGTLTLRAGDVTRQVTYDALGRRLDVDALVAEAMAVGRGGPTIERLASNVRILVRGVDLAPQATFEEAALRFEITALATAIAKPATNAAAAAGASDFVVTPATSGRSADVETALRAAETLLEDPGAPDAVSVELPVTTIEPDVTTAEAAAATAAAARIAVDTTLVKDGESWTIRGPDLRSWITFSTAPDGSYRPVVAKEGLDGGLAAIATDVAIAPVNATFLISDTKRVIGVTSAKEGRALDIPATEVELGKVFEQRAAGLTVSRVAISLSVIEPELTTAEATRTAPLHPRSRLQGRWRDHRWPHGAPGSLGGRYLLDLHDDLQRGPSGGPRDGSPGEPLLLHRPLSAGPRRDRLPEQLRIRPDDVLAQRHRLADPHPELPLERREQGLRPLPALVRADRADRLDLDADRQERPAGERFDGLHDDARPGRQGPGRVPRRG